MTPGWEPRDAQAVADPGGLRGALAVARVVLLGYAVVVNAVHWSDYRRPWLAALTLAAMTGWTLLAPGLSAVRSRWAVLAVVEVGLACGALLVTPAAQGTEVAADTPSVPSFWIAAAVMACAVRWGWRGGLAGALVVTSVDVVVDVSADQEFGATTGANIFLLVVTGLIVGYAAALVRSSVRDRAEAAAMQAATAERERLARAVHDGVLQTLAYVQRRGAEIGGATAELATLAGEQEVALRGLVHARGTARAAAVSCDVAELLHLQVGSKVSVATPGGAVPLAAHAGAELVAAVRAALENTARHAPDASAFVLLEDDGTSVLVSVGDDGPGIPPGRLAEAAAAGRMGVSHSISGRLAAIGGTAQLRTGPGTGTEWELRVPRSPDRTDAQEGRTRS